MRFNPRRPRGRRLRNNGSPRDDRSFNPRRPRGRRPSHSCPAGLLCVSIHAAREGGDYAITAVREMTGVSIHAAREGGDSPSARTTCAASWFQSTPPARAATRLVGSTYPPLMSFQSTPPARAATACPQLTERQALLDLVPRTALAAGPPPRPHQIEIP